MDLSLLTIKNLLDELLSLKDLSKNQIQMIKQETKIFPSKISTNKIRNMAPILCLHPKEIYYPVDPVIFILKARFSSLRGDGNRFCYNKRARKWIPQEFADWSSDYTNIPIKFINKFGEWPKGKNQRPHNDNCGKKPHFWIERKGKPKGNYDPNNGKVPAFYRAITVEPPKVTLIQFWWFMGYSIGWGVWDHQGDWERVVVLYDHERDYLFGIIMHQHYEWTYYPYRWYPKVDDHPMIYCAKGSHASYPPPQDNQATIPVFSFMFIQKEDKIKKGGYRWKTWTKLEPLEKQPWKNFAGAWGDMGTLNHTTGPLGPLYKAPNFLQQNYARAMCVWDQNYKPSDRDTAEKEIKEAQELLKKRLQPK